MYKVNGHVTGPSLCCLFGAIHFKGKHKTKQSNDESATLVGIYYTRLQNMAFSKCIHE
jgi:hypothetical protein